MDCEQQKQPPAVVHEQIILPPQTLEIEVPESQSTEERSGGWRTVPFLLGSALTGGVAINGATVDVIVYLMKKFSVSGVDAAQISNIINALTAVAPVAGAILCDSILGCFPIIAIFLFISLLRTVMLTLTALLPPCHEALGSPCISPTRAQVAALFLAFTLITVGTAGTSYTYVTIGAAQFDKPRDQETYINWFAFNTSLAAVVASTVLVYVLDNVGWVWGYGTCALLSGVSLVLFLSGKRWYRQIRPEGSPFADLARVVVAAIRKFSLVLPADHPPNYYDGRREVHGAVEKKQYPTSALRCLNKAALIVEGDVHSDGSIAKPWRLCNVHQVEDLKTVLKTLPLLASGIMVSASYAILTNMSILQALTMDRSLGSHFTIPAASFQVFFYLCTAVSIPILDRFFHPVCQKLIGKSVGLIPYIGIGYLTNTMAMVVAAVVESARLKVLHSHGLHENPAGATVVSMSSLWLVPQLIAGGLALAFYAPGQLSFFYEEFPPTLKNCGSSMGSVILGAGFYLSTGIIDVVRKTTEWVPEDINDGHLDYVFWMLAVLGAANLGYYVVCAKLYRSRDIK